VDNLATQLTIIVAESPDQVSDAEQRYDPDANDQQLEDDA
jgi:hypothetical protein